VSRLQRSPCDAGPADGGRGDAGSVTAELALGLPTLVLVLAVCLHVQAASALQARTQDAARAGARALARGDPEPVVRQRVATAMPAGTLVRIRRSPTGPADDPADALVEVEVSAPWPAPDLLRFAVADRQVSARASTPEEAGSFAVVDGSPDG
jgi:hypothetical protein